LRWARIYPNNSSRSVSPQLDRKRWRDDPMLTKVQRSL
jgi:hypothetical protein